VTPFRYPPDGAEPFGLAFPGQGNKRDAVVDALRAHRAHPLVAELLAVFRADEPDALDLGSTAVAQPATYTAGVAAVESALGIPGGAPMVLGHSLGELTAAACGGFIDVRSGFQLAMRRGALCEEQNARRCGAMVAVMGTDLHGIEWLRRQVVGRTGGVLEVAGLNGRRQTVLSGDHRAVEECIRLAGEAGLLAEILPIGGSFHSPVMLPVIPAWREAVESHEFRAGGARFVSTVDAQVHSDPMEIRELLVRALLLPVRWLDTLHTVRREGVRRLLDAGPGTTLHKLGRREKIIDIAPLVAEPAVVEAAK
jgi:[acyl-carrier-protein] S-malonyltransferase